MVAGAPSSYIEQLGTHLEDRALATIQGLVDNPTIGGRLINALWHLVRLGAFDGTLVLSDRPLVRLGSYEHPGAAWLLPLTPQVAFVAVNHPINLERIKRVSPQRFAKQVNAYSANQAERFVFCADASHEPWLAKRLSKRGRASSGAAVAPSTTRRSSGCSANRSP